MRGSVYKKRLPSGAVVWQLQLDAGRDETGRRVRISRNFPRKGDADQELARLIRERQAGLIVRASPKTVGEFLGEWVQEYARRNCTPLTAQRYEELLDYAVEAVGEVRLSDLTPLMLEKLYGRLQDGHGKAGRRLSARTIRHVHNVIRGALNTAVRWRLVSVNPALACALPKVEKKEARILEDAELQWLLDSAVGHPWLYTLLVVATATGLRRGELLALIWSDVDFVRNAIEVSKSIEQSKRGLRVKAPKSGKTRRLTLPAIAGDALREHRRAQQRNRDAFGKDYCNLGLVFATPAGQHLKPNTVSPAVRHLAVRCGLKGISLHSIRHTHGSQLLRAGVPLVTVSRRLGHSNVAITAAVYSHAFAADEVAAAEAWNTKIGEVIRRPQAHQ